MTGILNSGNMKFNWKESVFLFSCATTPALGLWFSWILKRFISNRHVCVQCCSFDLCACFAATRKYGYPRNKSLRDSSASSPCSDLPESFPLFYTLFLLHAYAHLSCKKYQGRNGARYFRSSTTSNVFHGFYYAERQNFAMMLCGPWRWCLAVNTATSPTASGVFQASGWAGIYK